MEYCRNNVLSRLNALTGLDPNCAGKLNQGYTLAKRTCMEYGDHFLV